MRKLLTALIACFVLMSCQKEISADNLDNLPGGGNGGSPNGTKLVRIGVRTGGDSITTNFAYNNAGRLTKFSQAGTIGGTLITAQAQYVRNAAEVISKTIIKTNALTQFGLDSIEAFHTYDVANRRYKYSLSPITIAGNTATDSVVYVYTGDKLTSAIDYYDDGSGGGYTPYSKEEYSYTGKNISQIKSYTYDESTRTYDLETTVNYEYDLKVNPISFPEDVPAISMLLYYSANNEVKKTVTDHLTGTTDVLTTAITYNNNNRPLSAVASSSGLNTISTYYYQ
ncbi:MAG TPA: hypothetical protein VMR70_07030 [Flavisolibacter sp.]|nr:hypothetical protein [Flavisolibacter sp.]